MNSLCKINILYSILASGKKLADTNDIVQAFVTSTGSLNVIDTDSEVVLWSTNRQGSNFNPVTTNFTLKYFSKGNNAGEMCVYGENKAIAKGPRYEFPVWCSGTSYLSCNKFPGYIKLQDDGDLVIISKDGDTLWWSGSALENELGIKQPGVNPSWSNDGNPHNGAKYALCK